MLLIFSLLPPIDYTYIITALTRIVKDKCDLFYSPFFSLKYCIKIPPTTQLINISGDSAQSNGIIADRKAYMNTAIRKYTIAFSILLLSPFKYTYIIHKR